MEYLRKLLNFILVLMISRTTLLRATSDIDSIFGNYDTGDLSLPPNGDIVRPYDNIREWKNSGWENLKNIIAARPKSTHSNGYPLDEDNVDFECEDCPEGEELESSLPYGIQNVRSLPLTAVTRGHGHHNKRLTFQSLCPSQKQTVQLNTDEYFEYLPDHYEEVTCRTPFRGATSDITNNKVCGAAGFSCVQLNRTIFLTRKLRGSKCWESETKIVKAGCECMWPKHTLGDIVHHH